MKTFKSPFLLSLMWVTGCAETLTDRHIVNVGVQSAAVNDSVNVSVAGASILTQPSELGQSTSNVYRVAVRAQSLDVRIDISSGQCDPVAVQIDLSHVEHRNSVTTVRHFYDALGPFTTAIGQATAQNLGLTTDQDSPSQTPIDAEQMFRAETIDEMNHTLRWTVCLHQPTGTHYTLAGHQDITQCPATVFEDTIGVCASHERVRALDVTSSSLVARYRVQTPLPQTFKFAVWGNIAGDFATLTRMAASINSTNVSFSVIAGDLTASGTTKALRRVKQTLDQVLEAPWYATLGDQDLKGNASSDYAYLLGASSFAFDANNVRVIVLDSADRSLGRSTLSRLANWLGDESLWWTTPEPTEHLVITHTPPFDPVGPRNLGFRLRAEGASFLGQLIRSKVGHLFTSSIPGFSQATIDGVKQIRVGGGTTAGTESAYWIEVTVDGSCDACGDKACPCIETKRIPVE